MKLVTYLIVLSSFLVFGAMSVSAQQPKKPRASQKATVVQRIGLDTDIQFDFSRPGVKGRKIWGEVVPFGLIPGNKYSKDKPFPWRGGANENTTIKVSGDVLVEGNKLPAGRYGLHFIPTETTWTVIFSKADSLWGSYLYDQANDALRITVTPEKAPMQEWLTYGFEDLADYSAKAYLHWAELKVPFKIEAEKKIKHFSLLLMLLRIKF